MELYGLPKGCLTFVIFLVFVTTLLGLLGPYLMGVIIDQYIVPKDLSGNGENVFGTYRDLWCNSIINLVTNICNG